MRIFVIGHKSPDLDAVAAPVAYTEFLTKLGRYANAQLLAVTTGPVNKETVHVFETFNVPLPPDINTIKLEESDHFILVDHQEYEQRHDAITDDAILEVLDHHKVNLNSVKPVRIDVKPLGSTSTLIYDHFHMSRIRPKVSTMGLLLCSILSDTQGLKSSTTTETDSAYAHELAEVLDVDLDTITFELFKAKSDISDMTTKELATKDYKVFEFGGQKVFINQIETVEPDKVLALAQNLISETSALKNELKVDQAYQIVTDVLNAVSFALCPDGAETEVVKKAFDAEVTDNIANIGPKLSRKKDIAPAIEKALQT